MSEKDTREVLVRLTQIVHLLALVVSGTAGELATPKGSKLAAQRISDIMNMVKA